LAVMQAELDAAAKLGNEAGELAGELGDPLVDARVVNTRGNVALLRGDPMAEQLLVEAMARYDALGEFADPYALTCRVALAAARLSRGDFAAAAETCRGCVAVCRAHGDQVLAANALSTLAYAEWLSGDAETAAAQAREILRTWRSAAITTEVAQAV